MLKIGIVQNTKNNCKENNRPKGPTSFCAFERTLIGFKPDAFEKKIVEELTEKLINKTGLKLAEEWEGIPDTAKMENHYAVHKGKSFFENLINYVTRVKFKAFVLEGENAVEKARIAALELRQEYDVAGKSENLIHSSDSVENASGEILNFFS